LGIAPSKDGTEKLPLLKVKVSEAEINPTPPVATMPVGVIIDINVGSVIFGSSLRP
jgi:hypothetical protein